MSLCSQNMMNLPPDKVKLLCQYDNEKKWELICDQVGLLCRRRPSRRLVNNAHLRRNDGEVLTTCVRRGDWQKTPVTFILSCSCFLHSWLRCVCVCFFVSEGAVPGEESTICVSGEAEELPGSWTQSKGTVPGPQQPPSFSVSSNEERAANRQPLRDKLSEFPQRLISEYISATSQSNPTPATEHAATDPSHHNTKTN